MPVSRDLEVEAHSHREECVVMPAFAAQARTRDKIPALGTQAQEASEAQIDAAAEAERTCYGGDAGTADGPVADEGRVCLEHRNAAAHTAVKGRSEERRVGKECRSRWSPYH